MSGFVVLEGIDGCGKSSVARLVAKRLGTRAVLTREPTDSWIGRAVRRGTNTRSALTPMPFYSWPIALSTQKRFRDSWRDERP